MAVVGAGPLALARAQRAQTARVLLETTTVPIIDVAFAAGFQSVRQFNATVREVFATTPGELRCRAQLQGRSEGSGAVVLRLPYRAPLEAEALIAFLGFRAVPGVDEVSSGTYRRSLRLPHGTGTVEFQSSEGHLRARYWLEDLRDLAAAVQRSRSLFDLDSDPHAVVEALGRDRLLGPLVRSNPGRRVPGHVDGNELAVRAVLGQQVSVAGAATLAGRLTLAYGQRLLRPLGAVTHVFPTAEALADADPSHLAMPATRRLALFALAGALARGEIALDAGVDRVETQSRLLALPGIGPWTVSYIAMRTLRDPDAFLPNDLGIRRALEHLGHDGSATAAGQLSERWRPYRAYAAQHLWAQLPAAALSTRARPSELQPNQVAA